MANTIGGYVWEKTHPKQVKAEKQLSTPYQYDQSPDTTMTKIATPAGSERDINKEDNTKRRAQIDEQIRKGEGD